MNAPYVATQHEKLLHGQVADLTMRVARPLIWHDHREAWPKRLAGGTCFILRFDGGLVGVTADHVVAAFEHAALPGAGVTSLLRTVPFDLKGALIARDANHDIATFSVTEDQLRRCEAVEIDCRASAWPPKDPEEGSAISFGGFPEIIKKESLHSSVTFAAFVDLTYIQAVTGREIIATYDPKRDSRVRAAPELPDVGANLSGCSGGPVLLHFELNGLHRWRPIGMMIAGPREQGTGSLAEFDMIRFQRIDVIQPDGSIKKDNIGIGQA